MNNARMNYFNNRHKHFVEWVISVPACVPIDLLTVAHTHLCVYTLREHISAYK